MTNLTATQSLSNRSALENSLHLSSTRQQLIVVDASLPALAVLLQDLSPQQSVLQIGKDEDAITAITHTLTALAQQNIPAESLVIVAHGRLGEVLIGQEVINLQQLKSRASDIKRWNVQNIQLFSCHTGGADHFVETLAQLSGATVFASEQAVGHAALGGNWLLESASGIVNNIVPFSETARSHWRFTLVPFAVEAASQSELPPLPAGFDSYAVTIPDSITEIGLRAFFQVPLTSVTIGNGVTSIGAAAFNGARLTSVTIPDSVTEIGAGAFGRSLMTSVTVNDYVSLAPNAFDTFTAIIRRDPTLTANITLSDATLTGGESTTVTITFTEAVTNLAVEDFTAENGTITDLSSVDGGITWSATLTSLVDVQDTTNRIFLDDTYTNLAGSIGNTVTSSNYTIDFNSAPTAKDDNFVTDEDSPLTGNVLVDNGNDLDIDRENNPLTVVAINGRSTSLGRSVRLLPSQAVVTLNADGTFEYDPTFEFDYLDVGETATDSFTYTVSDGIVTDSATVTITINGRNDAPRKSLSIPSATLSNTVEDRPIVVNAADLLAGFTDRDREPLSVANLRASNGTLVENVDNGEGLSLFIFTPTADFNGTVELTYDVTDGRVVLPDQTLSFEVTPINDAPIAVDDQVTTDYETPITIQSSDLLANDTDADSADLHIVAVGNTTGGTAVLPAANGDTILFTPEVGFNGNASFDYTLSDGSLVSTATVTVAITESGLTLNGTNRRDTLRGTSGNDTMLGRDNSDILNGLGGNDLLFGDNGNDLLLGGLGDDTLNGGYGRDQLIGGLGDDVLIGGSARDTLIGGEGRDSLDGGNGKDLLNGGLGDDLLNGGSGKDTLIGGGGDDQLTGGLGKDTFVLAKGEGRDTITDFSIRQDKLSLSGGLSLGELSFVGNDILLTSTNEVLATLTGIDTSTLKASKFTTF